MKITHNLIDKIHHDLVWWRDSNNYVVDDPNKKTRKNNFTDEH